MKSVQEIAETMLEHSDKLMAASEADLRVPASSMCRMLAAGLHAYALDLMGAVKNGKIRKEETEKDEDSKGSRCVGESVPRPDEARGG
jgi:hypothetical protein